MPRQSALTNYTVTFVSYRQMRHETFLIPISAPLQA